MATPGAGVVAHSGRDRPRGARARQQDPGAGRGAAGPGPGRRGVQRRRRLGVPRRRRPSHAGCRARPRRHRRVAVARRVRARRLPRAGGGVGAALDAGRDRRDGPGRVPDQRHRPLLPLQGRADGRRSCRSPTADGARIVLGVNVDDLGDHRPGQRAASEAGASFPLVAAGFTKADVRAASRRARPAHVGQAGRRLPGQPGAVRDGRVRRRAVGRRAGRGRAAPRSGSTRSASATTATRRASRSTWSISSGCWPLARPSSPASGVPATATSRSTSRASGPATSTADRRRPSPSRTEAAAEPWRYGRGP